MTDEQIARNIGINTATLYDWKNKYANIAKALKSGKEVADFAVQSALFKKALGGDTMAIMYWLNNRRPDKWRRNPVPSGAEAEESDNLYQAIIEAVKK